MNKKGFTLVELMVVIVIIGILAAVAAPKLSDNINAARCNEVPKKFKEIMDKQVEKEAADGYFTPYAVADIDAGLGITTANSKFWEYKTDTANGVLTITANIKSGVKIGSLGSSDAWVSVNSEGTKSFKGAVLGTKYMKAYLSGVTASN